MKDGLNRRDMLKLSVASSAAFAAGGIFKIAEAASNNQSHESKPQHAGKQPSISTPSQALFEGFESLNINTGEVEINLKRAGRGKPVLLLHGYPETHAMWHKIAPRMAKKYTVILPDLRGYGDSSTPSGTENHSNYSKRVMALDQIKVMERLGYKTFDVVGHDRGARVAHRLMRDYPDRINRGAVMDIMPTLDMYEKTDMTFARGYYHWFFLIQPFDLPEHMIGGDPAYFVRRCLNSWSRNAGSFPDEVVAEYIRCFSKPGVIHGTCEDYRASATIDLEHDRQERYKKIQSPLLVLWGGKSFISRAYDVLGIWRQYAVNVEGRPIPSGHFLPEESPEETYDALVEFLDK
jgi:haloacetate dehalogenase